MSQLDVWNSTLPAPTVSGSLTVDCAHDDGHAAPGVVFLKNVSVPGACAGTAVCGPAGPCTADASGCGPTGAAGRLSILCRAACCAAVGLTGRSEEHTSELQSHV